ncbi:ribonuclease D [Aquisalinus flavus]|uniref:3'-5' exonuclease n=1 Tax=Aquisalinus flavus TaxID=1526572 RepID=A0A8J2V394_9PROT|nr:ribonuclease D [Aquisalinus flavus]MBD0425805.1 ribonuclease D [Aquisalinus flavus]GGD13093.1 3'-5' exonuclease [Aquisalinus flavus]
MTIHLHKNDLPDNLTFSGAVAVDSETMGLNPLRDKLCLVQLCGSDGDAHLVQLDRSSYDAPNLKNLLADPAVEKIFHFARFDFAVFRQYLGVETKPIYCTKIASRLVRTYTDRHGLKELVRELIGVEMSKQQQSSDWGAAELSDSQKEYAAADVIYLHEIKSQLDQMLEREGRTGLARACFGFLPARCYLDLAGWDDVDIFSHS